MPTEKIVSKPQSKEPTAKDSGDSPASSETSNPTPFIDATTANEAYTDSNRWFLPYYDPIDEFERLARNKPSDKIPSNLPKITDGTLASIIQEDPKRIIQVLAGGLVTSQDCPEYAMIADLVHRHRLLPMYNRMGTALQKHWNMLGKAMTWGRSTSYTFFTSTSGQFHTDFVIPYVKDIITEKGKVYAPDSNISFMRSWYQKRDLKAILNREKWLIKNKEGYKPEWDLKLLEQFMNEGGSMKPANLQTPAERDKGGDAGGYEVIHAFQDGIGAEFYSFSPRFKDGVNLRTKTNKDPRGKMPLDHEYCNIDLSNPLGRGAVEMSGGVQNLIDQQMQMFQFMSTLEMGPPLQVWGNVNKNTLKFRPNAIWDMGTNATNKVEPYVVQNSSLANFSNNYSLLKSQILQLNNSQDTSIPSSAGNVTQSKTQAGVKNSQQRLGVSDNYLEKQHEAWFAAQSETSINIFFAEMTGNDTVQLSELDIEKLEGTPAEKFILDRDDLQQSDQSGKPKGVEIKDDKLNITYKDINNVTFKFKTDAGSSKETDDLDQLEKIQEVVKEVGEAGPVLSYYLGQSGIKLNVGELYKQRFERLGLKNLDVILTKMDAQEAEAAKQAPFPIIDKPQIRINTADLTAEQTAAALQAGGINPQQPQQPTQPGQPPAGLSPQGVADFYVEMAKAQSGQQGTDPNELAIKQHELQIKQQNADDTSTKTAIELHKQAHQQTMDIHNAAAGQVDQQFNQQHQTQQQQFDQQNAQAQQQQQAQQSSQTSDSQQGSNDSNAQQQPQQDDQQELQQVQQDLGDQPLDPQEIQIAEQLFHRGFQENDVEQAITMLRQGMPIDQVMQTIGAKYAAQQ